MIDKVEQISDRIFFAVTIRDNELVYQYQTGTGETLNSVHNATEAHEAQVYVLGVGYNPLSIFILNGLNNYKSDDFDEYIDIFDFMRHGNYIVLSVDKCNYFAGADKG